MSYSIPSVPLNDKRAIPAIGFGTGTALYGKDATAYVVQAIRGGFNHIDTAQAYKNENSVGDALRRVFHRSSESYDDEKLDLEYQPIGQFRRNDIWITTKYNGRGNAEEALNQSLEKLGLSFVDLYLIHNPRLVSDILKTWSEFESAHTHGKAKSIGVSNFDVHQLKQLVEHINIIPSVNQIKFHPYNYHEHIELLAYAKKHDIVIESYSGLTPITKLPGGKLDGVLTDIAARLGPKVTPAQVILKWVYAKGVVIVTTTSRKERIEEYLSVFDLPELTQDEIAAIDEAGKHPPTALLPSRSELPKYTATGLKISIATLCLVILTYRMLCFWSHS